MRNDDMNQAAQMAVEWISRWMEMPPEADISHPYFSWAAERVEEMTQDGKIAARYVTGFVHLCGQLMVDMASAEYDDYESLTPEQKIEAGRKTLQETILNMILQ